VGALCNQLCIVECTEFYLSHFTKTFNFQTYMRSLVLPYPKVHLANLNMCALLVSLKLPVNSNNIQESFLNGFWGLQAKLLEGLSNYAGNNLPFDANEANRPVATDGSESISENMYYGLMFRWLHFTADLDFGIVIRSLVAYILGQCLVPPRKAPPSIGNYADKSSVKTNADGTKDAGALHLDNIQLSNVDKLKDKDKREMGLDVPGDPMSSHFDFVCECVEPTMELSELLTDEIAKEDKRMVR
jgi:hypothetical protein